jgi:trehalose 6-phosphate phosphatase
MVTLRENIDVDGFFTDLSRASQSLLMLDYDGTLAPFTTEREQAYPYPGVRERLNQLLGSSRTRLVIVSGRPTEDLEALLGLERTPEMFGQHGAERRMPDGSVHTVRLRETTKKGLAEIDAWAKDNHLLDCLETKVISRSFHWRGLPAERVEDLKARVLDRWEGNVAPYGIEVHKFDGGLEFKASGIDKGHAVNALFRDVERSAVAAYLGDDRTDEDAFRALGDRGLTVLVRPDRRETVADLWLRPPEELLAFLDRWIESIDA